MVVVPVGPGVQTGTHRGFILGQCDLGYSNYGQLIFPGKVWDKVNITRYDLISVYQSRTRVH